MFAQLGRAVTRRPVTVIAIWLALVAAALAVSGALGTASPSSNEAGDLPSHYESAQAQAILDREFPVAQPPGSATLVITRQDGAALTAADATRVGSEVRALQVRLTQQKTSGATTSLGDHQLSPNRLVEIVPVSFDKDSADSATTSAVGRLRSAIKSDLADTQLRARVTGDAAMNKDNSSVQALISYGMVVAIFVLLLLIFRSLVVALTTVATIAVVAAGVGALLNIAAHAFDFSLGSTVQGLLPVVLFGVGTDYVVFLLFRYRERLRNGDDHRTALAVGIGRVGEAVVASALAVAASFSVMLVSQLQSFRVLGPALALAVVVMLFTSLTLVPAVLTLLGKRLARRPLWRREPRAGVTGALGSLAVRRPALVAAACIGVLVLGAIAMLGYHASYESDGYPKGSESAAGNVDLQRGFPAGASTPTQVVVTAADGRLSSSSLADVAAVVRGTEGVGQVGDAQLSKDATAAVFSVSLTDDPQSTKALDVVSALEHNVHAKAPAGTTVTIGGATSAYNDVRHALKRDIALILPIAGLAILLILLLMLRALVAPLLLMASVGLGFLATTGAAVVMFQHVGHTSGLVFSMPLVVYLFVASLGTDYNILMVSRLREEVRRGASPRQAALVAIRQAGPAVAAAGMVLAVSFGILMTAGGSLAEIGFAVAAGALISTFVMAFLLTPALFTMLGHRVWWPSRPAPRHGRQTTGASSGADGHGSAELVAAAPWLR
jgi:RND superfamily putative drug exporter